MLCRFLAGEEEITIDYRFGVYDLLVLPPAFPYGGMVRTASAIALVYFSFASGRKTRASRLLRQVSEVFFCVTILQTDVRYSTSHRRQEPRRRCRPRDHTLVVRQRCHVRLH